MIKKQILRIYSVLFFILVSCNNSVNTSDSQIELDISNKLISTDMCTLVENIYLKFKDGEYKLSPNQPFVYNNENNGKYIELLTRMKEDDGSETESLKLYLLDKNNNISLIALFYTDLFNVKMVAKIVKDKTKYDFGKIDGNNICSIKTDWPDEYVTYIINEINTEIDSAFQYYLGN